MERRREEERERETGQKLEFSFDCSTVTMTTTKSASEAATDNGDAEGANERAGECLNVISKRVRREKVQSPRENFPREQHNISALGKRKERGGAKEEKRNGRWLVARIARREPRYYVCFVPPRWSGGRNVAKTATAREMTVKLRCEP